MANGDDKKGKLPEGYQLDQEWESGEGPTAAATTAAGQSTPPGARDTTGTLGKLGAISRTVGDTVRGAVTPSKPQGKTASEEAGEAIKRGWRALITPPPPRLPPQGPARETMSAQPGFWQETGRLAAQGPFQMEPRAPAYENMTPEGRAEHPVLARVGDVTRGAKEYGGMLLNLGGLLAGPEYEEFPTAAPRPAPHVPGSQMPAVPRTTLRDIGNVLEQEMNRAPQPRVEARFDDAAHELFGQSYENLNAQQKQAVARRAVPAPTERATIQPVERRAAPAGPPPAGRTEQRMPWVEQTFGHAAPGAESDIDLELRAPAAPPGTIEPVGTVKPAPWKPPSTAGGRVVRGGKVVPEAGAPPPATFTRETKGGADWAVGPGGTYRVSVTPGMSDAEIEQKLAEQKTIHEGMNIPRRPPPQPGTPERPPPTAVAENTLDADAGHRELYSITKNAGYSIPTREIFPNDVGLSKRELYDATQKLGKGWTGAASEPAEVKLKTLQGIQNTIEADAIYQNLNRVKSGSLTTDLTGDKLHGALVVRYQGKDYIVDGNHRLAALKLAGADSAKVHLVDLDAAEDPLKREFPDAGVRRFARANGPELVRRYGDDAKALEAVHKLTNVDIREAAINAGIDLGTKHVGSKQALGSEQISRQYLIDQMINRGMRPEDIVEFSKPQTRR